MRINLKDKQILSIIEAKLEVRVNALSLKVKKLENKIRLINSKLNKEKNNEVS
tara:strand:- start:488 stop:646 length:159 start_codon:yes stop_codon:yes gene_type:complete